MPISKIAKMKFETSAYYVPLGNTDIVFWNTDTNGSAMLNPRIYRNNEVLSLGKSNVQTMITLFAADGSNITDKLEIEDELEGILSYTIPDEFLKHTGTVYGQIYISVNGTEETVTEADFTFEIKDALINKISSETKISYIRTFDDLRAEVQKRVKAIEEAIEHGQDYVTAIENARDEAIQSIATKVATAKTDIDGKIATATTDLNKTATDAKKAVTDTATTATANVTNTADNAVAQVLQTKKDFDDDVAKGSFLKASDVANYQKIALTGADGVAKRISNADCNTLLDLGFYYLPSPINQPSGWGGLYLIVIPGSTASTTSYYKQIGFQYATGKIATRDRKSGPMSDNTLWTDWTIIETEAGSTQKVADLKTLMLKLAPSAESGGVKLSISSTEDVLTAFANAPQGIYGVYVQGGATNSHPSGGACRGIVMKSSADIGFIELVNTKGVTATNYLNSTLGWGGWVMSGTTDTGWLNLPLKNGTLNTGGIYPNSVYRVLTVNGIKQVFLRMYISNISTQTIVASIPLELSAASVISFPITAKVTKGPGKITIDKGDIYFYKNANDTWAVDDYAFVEANWVL